MTPLLFFGTLCVLVLRSYTLVQQVERGQKKGAEKAEAEVKPDESAEPVPDSASPVRDEEKGEVESADSEEKAEPARGGAPVNA